jgi:hypothetical protein
MKRSLLILSLAMGFAATSWAQTTPPTTPPLPNLPYIFYGGHGIFQFNILGNGNPYTPVGKYVPAVKWSCDDATVTLTPSADTMTVTAATVATDTASAFILTGVLTAPDGTVLTETITVPLWVYPLTYTANIEQTGSVGP